MAMVTGNVVVGRSPGSPLGQCAADNGACELPFPLDSLPCMHNYVHRTELFGHPPFFRRTITGHGSRSGGRFLRPGASRCVYR